MKTKTIGQLYAQFLRINDDDKNRRRWRIKTPEIYNRYKANIFAHLGETTRGEDWAKPENRIRIKPLYNTPIPRNIYMHTTAKAYFNNHAHHHLCRVLTCQNRVPHTHNALKISFVASLQFLWGELAENEANLPKSDFFSDFDKSRPYNFSRTS